MSQDASVLNASRDEIEHLFDQTRWMHKILEKQVDIYRQINRMIEIVTVILISITASGVLSVALGNAEAAIPSAIVAFVSLLMELVNAVWGYPAKIAQASEGASGFLELRESCLSMLYKINWGCCDELTAQRFCDASRIKYVEMCRGATTSKLAVKLAEGAFQDDEPRSPMGEEAANE